MTRQVSLALLLLGISARASALPFEPGEQLVLGVTYMHMNIGNVELTVGEDVQSNIRVWPLRMKAKTTGFFNHIHSADDTLVSTLDPSSLHSLGTFFDQHESNQESQETIRIEGTTAYAHRVTPGGTRDRTAEVQQGAVDLLTGVYYLRAQNLETASDIHVPIFTGWRSWDLVAHVAGHQTVKTEAGEFETIVVRCKTYFNGSFSSQKEMTLWFSNDDRHLLVKVEADFVVGTMRAELKSYHQGPVAQR